MKAAPRSVLIGLHCAEFLLFIRLNSSSLRSSRTELIFQGNNEEVKISISFVSSRVQLKMRKMGMQKEAHMPPHPLPVYVCCSTPALLLTQHGEHIFTAVRVTDRGASRELLPAHNRLAGSEGFAGGRRVLPWRRGRRVQGILSHRRSY